MRAAAVGAQRRRGLDRRQAMVLAGIELVGERGPNAVTLKDIGRRVGTSHAAVLYHFRSRTELLLAVLEARDEENRAAWERVFAPGGLEALRTLPQVARLVLEQTNFTKLRLVLAAECLGDDHVGRYFQRRYHWMRSGLAHALRTAQQRGDARADLDVDARAAEIAAFMDGIALQHLLEPGSVDIVAVYADFVEGLVRDIAPRP
jgi:AcrR family transcriptional regulator